MKREDAISQLQDFLCELFENVGMLSTEKVLDFIEKELGMKPPEYRVTDLCGCCSRIEEGWETHF